MEWGDPAELDAKPNESSRCSKRTMANPDHDELRRRKELSEARRRMTDEIFERQRAQIDARRRAEDARGERRRRILRLLTFGRAAFVERNRPTAHSPVADFSVRRAGMGDAEAQGARRVAQSPVVDEQFIRLDSHCARQMNRIERPDLARHQFGCRPKEAVRHVDEKA
jgi:hypothetical protein